MSKPSYSFSSLTLDLPSGEVPTGATIHSTAFASASTNTLSSFPTPTNTNPLWNSTETGTRTTLSRVSTPTATNSERSGKIDSNISIETVFYFIAFLVIMVAVVYVVDMARRRRKRRRLAREQNQDPEAALQSGHNSTYRPQNENDEDGSPPPQYRAYTLDQPYVDPEMVLLYPDQAHCRLETNSSTGSASSQQGLIRNNSPSAGTASSSMMDDLQRPLHTTANTAAAATSTSTSRSITAPNANNIATPDTDAVACVTIDQDQTQPLTSRLNSNNSNNGSPVTTSNSNGASVPVISAPSPAFSFTSGGPWSRFRSELGRNNRRHSRNTSRDLPTNASTAATAITTAADPAAMESRPVSQITQSSELLLAAPSIVAAEQEASAELGSSTTMTERIGGSGSGILHPSLLRLRSQGPPPYVPLTTDDALPQLPPEYNTAVTTSV
ncbi:hypothetical protein BG011_002606 [Mortierella polycephala]|uniref:Uncharacterized protein n=1 Tax=Mortierella polycephala TaxID=41804 RepID=A0A9P6Q768_9FUNG|nr:hypothetical protein BG011_002606 [Mortierella polycephala]